MRIKINLRIHKILGKQPSNEAFVASFRSSAEQLKAIALHGQTLLEQATDTDLRKFTE